MGDLCAAVQKVCLINITVLLLSLKLHERLKIPLGQRAAVTPRVIVKVILPNNLICYGKIHSGFQAGLQIQVCSSAKELLHLSLLVARDRAVSHIFANRAGDLCNRDAGHYRSGTLPRRKVKEVKEDRLLADG